MATGETKIVGTGGAIGLTLGASVVVCTAFMSGFINGCKTSQTHFDRPELLCTVLKPIQWSTSDSRETAEQVIVHNNVWKAYCDPLVKENTDG